MEIKNKIGNLIDIDWLNNLYDLQPENVKIPINLNYLKQSIVMHGVALHFAVWNDKGKYYCIDGHTRKQILIELVADGVEVPTKLKAFEILAKDRQEAIKILVEVYNQKHNPFAEEILTEWLEVEEIDIENLQSVNVMSESILQEPNFDELTEEHRNLPATMKITFENVQQLQKAKIDIQELIDRKYQGAFFKVSAGEL